MSALINVYEDNSIIDGEFFMDYENALAGANEADAYSALESYYQESEILLKARLEGFMVMEEVEVGKNTIENQPRTQKNVKGVINNIKEFFKRMIKFISDALNKFMEGISNSMKDNMEWYKANAQYIETVKKEFANDIKFDVVDYWNTGAEKNMATAGIPMKPNSIKDIIADIVKKGPNGVTKDTVYQTYFPEFAKLSHDPKTAAQMYYEGAKAQENGQNGVTPTSRHFENGDAIKALQHIEAFMNNYQTFINVTNQTIKNKENELKAAMTYLDSLNNTGTAEGYVFSPDLYSPVANESLFTFTNLVDENRVPAYKAFLGFIDVSEMDATGGVSVGNNAKTAPATKNANTTTGGDATTGANAGQTQNAGNNTNGQNQQDEGNMAQFRTIANSIASIYGTIASSRLTAVKRMCDHYCNVLRGVVDGVKKAKGIQDQNAENDKYNKEQTARERQAQKDREQKISDNRRAYNKSIGGVKGAWNQFWGNKPPK